MKIKTIPCLRDNFAYLIQCEQTGDAAIVDPSEAAPIIAAIQTEDVQLKAILNTHHHWDHTGGNEGLLAKWPGLAVYGHASDRGRIAGQTEFLEHGDTLEIGQLSGQIIHNPGHTTGAISYWFKAQQAIFTGDTLFAAGCGRTFEGTAAQMHHALNHAIGAVPAETQVYFGHEYTCKNLEFAQTVEPNNEAVSQRLHRARAQRERGEWTTPCTLADEWETNPFMRCQTPEIQAHIQKVEPQNDLSPTEIFRVLRALKDQF